MKILMCAPDYFGIEYEINPWMHVSVKVDREAARAQWQALYDTYRDFGFDIELVSPVVGLPDMVFTANAGVIWKRRAVLSRFRHGERRGEQPFWREAFERLGFEVHDVPEEVAFEGAGDALFMGDRLVLGSGFRTDAASHPLVAALLEVDFVSVELVDSRFYHLDTCFCPLDGDTALYFPGAFSAASAIRLGQTFPNLIEVPEAVATGFACNALAVDGTVIASPSIAGIGDRLAAGGWQTTLLPMGEYMKSGGSVRCLTLPLDFPN